MHNRKKIAILFCFEKNCGGESIAIDSIIAEFNSNRDFNTYAYTGKSLISTNFFQFVKWIISSIANFFLQFKKIKEKCLTYTTTYTAACAAIPYIITRKTKVVFHYHGNRVPDYPINLRGLKFYSQFTKYLLAYFLQNLAFFSSDLIITPSSESRDFINDKYLFLSKRKIIIIPNGYDQNKFYPIPRKLKKSIKKSFMIPVKHKVLLYCGRLEPKKNIEKLVNFVVKYNKKTDIHCIIAHNKPENFTESKYAEKLYNIIKKNHLSSLITTIEDAYSKYPPAHIYGLADCVISFSKIEVMSLVKLESIACGVDYVSPLCMKKCDDATHAASWKEVADMLSTILKKLNR